MVNVNVKSEVEYKLPKKMKKRRQLDALVDTMKLPKGRKNGSSTQDLLDYNSDSSEVDEFSLPQMAAKRKNRCCVCQSMIARISLFIISMACMTTCFGLIWVQWHIRHELDTLRSQVHAVQTNEKLPSGALIKLQSQVDQANKTLLDLRGGLDEFNKTLNSLVSKIADIEVKNSALEKSVSSAKELVGIPIKLNTLAETVAKLGSDQSQTSMDLEAKYKLLENSINELKSSQGGLSTQGVQGQVDDLRQSITSQIGNVTSVLSLQESKLSSLEALVQTVASQTAPLNTSNDSVSKLNEQVSATLEDLKKTYLSGNITERGEFLAFKQETFSNTEKINQTLYILSNEFDSLSGRLDTIDSAVINITSAINLFRNDVNLKGRSFNESTSENS